MLPTIYNGMCSLAIGGRRGHSTVEVSVWKVCRNEVMSRWRGAWWKQTGRAENGSTAKVTLLTIPLETIGAGPPEDLEMVWFLVKVVVRFWVLLG